jgi:hypothetical protein
MATKLVNKKIRKMAKQEDAVSGGGTTGPGNLDNIGPKPGDIPDGIWGTATGLASRVFSKPGFNKIVSEMTPTWMTLQFALVGAGVGALYDYYKRAKGGYSGDVKSLAKAMVLGSLAGVSLNYLGKLLHLFFGEKGIWEVNPSKESATV